MATNSVDTSIQFVLDNMHTIVASEGGSLELMDMKDGRLTVKYHKGQNEECPECVPDHAMVREMMQMSLGIHAPYVTSLELL